MISKPLVITSSFKTPGNYQRYETPSNPWYLSEILKPLVITGGFRTIGIHCSFVTLVPISCM